MLSLHRGWGVLTIIHARSLEAIYDGWDERQAGGGMRWESCGASEGLYFWHNKMLFMSRTMYFNPHVIVLINLHIYNLVEFQDAILRPRLVY